MEPATPSAAERGEQPPDRHPSLRDGTPVSLWTTDRARGAATGADEHAAIFAAAGARTVGRASYARLYGPRAEVTLEIDDDFWHRGLPELLLARLCAGAADAGISTFVIRARASDVLLLALLRERFAARGARDGAHVDLELSTAAAARSGWATAPAARSAPIGASATVHRLKPKATTAPTLAATRVADVMHSPVITCPPQTPIRAVAQTMADEHVHAVVVTGIELTPWGVVTALDIAAAAATGHTIALVARDVATTAAVTASVDMSLPDAARAMVEHQVNHLLVADADGRPAGIVSTSDIAGRFAVAE
jgi:CBS domain-containing protein